MIPLALHFTSFQNSFAMWGHQHFFSGKIRVLADIVQQLKTVECPYAKRQQATKTQSELLSKRCRLSSGRITLASSLSLLLSESLMRSDSCFPKMLIGTTRQDGNIPLRQQSDKHRKKILVPMDGVYLRGICHCSNGLSLNYWLVVSILPLCKIWVS